MRANVLKKILTIAFLPLFTTCQSQLEVDNSHCDLTNGILVAEEFRCGSIQVSENHEAKDGKKIQISYILIKSKNKESKKHPVLHFTGGPGGPSLTKGRIRNWKQHPFREERDIIIFDQRGIGYSSAVPNIESDLLRIMADDLTYEEELVQTNETISNYRKECKQQNIKLAHYNSFQNANDAGVLMNHLGYDQYNLYGGSYGTRLARIVQDKFRQQVNAVILNSPSPLSGDFLVDRLENYLKALNRIFDYCANDPACSREYPNLKDNYLKALERLKSEPISVTVDDLNFTVNVQDGIYLLRRMLYRTDSRTEIPKLIQAFLDGGGPNVEEIVTYEMQFTGGFNASMMMAVERHEQYNPAYTSTAVEKYYESSELLPAKLGYFSSLYEACRDWHNNPLAENQKEFEPSSIPTLIMVNQYDPVTPPENGPLMMTSLSNGQLYVLDEGGHGGGNAACRSRVMIDFMDNPLGKIDTSCLNIYKK